MEKINIEDSENPSRVEEEGKGEERKSGESSSSEDYRPASKFQ
jgi:hypothetical protein